MDRKLGRREAVIDGMVIKDRSNLALAGEHRVRVSFTNTFTSYPAGRGAFGGPSSDRIKVENVWTGTVTANEVAFKVAAGEKER